MTPLKGISPFGVLKQDDQGNASAWRGIRFRQGHRYHQQLLKPFRKSLGRCGNQL